MKMQRGIATWLHVMASGILASQDAIVLSELVDVDGVLSELAVINDGLSGPATSGFVWWFTSAPLDSIWASPAMLVAGVRGAVGSLTWWDSQSDDALVPAEGTNPSPPDYLTYSGHHGDVPAESEVPMSTIYDAIREFARTGERPSCVDWKTVHSVKVRLSGLGADAELPHMFEHLTHGMIDNRPGLDAETLIAELAEYGRRATSGRGRSWWLHPALDDTAPSAHIGVRGDVGTIQVAGKKVGADFVPAPGLVERPVPYFTETCERTALPVGPEIPVDVVYQAVRELVDERRFPTCVDWVELPTGWWNLV